MSVVASTFEVHCNAAMREELEMRTVLVHVDRSEIERATAAAHREAAQRAQEFQYKHDHPEAQLRLKRTCSHALRRLHPCYRHQRPFQPLPQPPCSRHRQTRQLCPAETLWEPRAAAAAWPSWPRDKSTNSGRGRTQPAASAAKHSTPHGGSKPPMKVDKRRQETNQSKSAALAVAAGRGGTGQLLALLLGRGFQRGLQRRSSLLNHHSKT